MQDYTQILHDLSKTWVIHDIRHVSDNTTRKDGHYPLRIGSTVQYVLIPGIGYGAVLPYVKDNKGSAKSGYIHTSPVQQVSYSTNAAGMSTVLITTNNSIFELHSV